MERGLRAHWSLVWSILALWVALAGVLLICIHREGGHFVYAVDDIYIAMAIAKNVVRHGVWGVNPFSFSWCSSTPLWTAVIILVYLIFGVSAGVPLALNFIVATTFVIVCYFLLRQRGLEQRRLLIALLSLIFLTSIPSLAFTGQEHILQALLTIVFIYYAAEDIAAAETRHVFALAALAPLVTTVRYEGMFLVAPVVALFVMRRRFRSALLIAALGAAPLVALGLWSLSHGWAFFPNSITTKANLLDSTATAAFVAFLRKLAVNLKNGYWLIAFAAYAAGCVYLSARFSGSLWERSLLAWLIYIAALAAQASFALTGGIAFFRYDAYLVAAGIFLLASCWREPWAVAFGRRLRANANGGRIRAAMIALFAIALFPRAIAANFLIPRASHNIYEHQFQMARFIHRFYRGQTVALEDIGAVTFASNVKLLDVAGLATRRVATDRAEHRFNNSDMAALSRSMNVDIAIVYDRYLFVGAERPSNWIKVGEWKISDAALVWDTVSFYGVGMGQARRLRANLEAFSSQLPKCVTPVIMNIPPDDDIAPAAYSTAAGDIDQGK